MSRLFALLLPLLLVACTTPPRIHNEKYSVPKTVALVEAPAMRNAAVIGPYYLDMHYMPVSDYFFLFSNGKPGGVPSTGEAGTNAALAQVNTPGVSGAGLVGGFVAGAIIDGMAASTQAKAEGLHARVAGRMPELDLRTEFTSALREALAAKGIATSLLKDSTDSPVRLRWSVGDTKLETNALRIDSRNLPAVDADLLVQYSPMAFYYAPGAMNNYRIRASVGVAIYNGRTKEYYGRQSFEFSPKAWENEYTTYSALESDIEHVVPNVRAALLSQVQKICDIISKTGVPH